VYSAGTSIRLDMRTDPFCIFVCQASLSHPDILVGDCLLAIEDIKLPQARHATEPEQRQIFEKCDETLAVEKTIASYCLLRFSSTLALLAAPVSAVIQRGHGSPREIRIKPDSIPNPERVLAFFEQLKKAATEPSEQPSANETAASGVLTDPYVKIAVAATVLVGS